MDADPSSAVRNETPHSRFPIFDYFQKNPRAHKNKIGTPPPPKKGEFYGHCFSCRKNAFFPGVHKIGAPISGPRIADTNFTDTRIFLIFSCESQGPRNGGVSNGGLPDLDLSFLLVPFWSFSGLFPIFLGFPDLSGDSGDFPDWSFSFFLAY